MEVEEAEEEIVEPEMTEEFHHNMTEGHCGENLRRIEDHRRVVEMMAHRCGVEMMAHQRVENLRRID
jgi:hypothetical protein